MKKLLSAIFAVVIVMLSVIPAFADAAAPYFEEIEVYVSNPLGAPTYVWDNEQGDSMVRQQTIIPYGTELTVYGYFVYDEETYGGVVYTDYCYVKEEDITMKTSVEETEKESAEYTEIFEETEISTTQVTTQKEVTTTKKATTKAPETTVTTTKAPETTVTTTQTTVVSTTTVPSEELTTATAIIESVNEKSEVSASPKTIVYSCIIGAAAVAIVATVIIVVVNKKKK